MRFETERNLKQTQAVLRAYEKYDGYDFNPETFDKVMFGRFIHYLLMKRRFRDSTIRKHLKTLRGFYK